MVKKIAKKIVKPSEVIRLLLHNLYIIIRANS